MRPNKDGKSVDYRDCPSFEHVCGPVLTCGPRFSNHWRWVVMLVVLLLGLLLLALAASLLKRRYNRRREARELGVQPNLSMWGPHGSGMHDFGVGEGYGPGGQKGREKQGADVGVSEPEKSHTGVGRRLRKT